MYQKHTVLGNCQASSGYQGNGVTNVNPEILYDLLDSHAQSSRGPLKRVCKEALTHMNERQWRISAGLHAGGLGGGGRAADPRTHITLSINGVGSLHVRFSIVGSTYRLIEITGL